MDFSSISRVLESVQRRQPPLPQSVLDACQALSTFPNENDDPSSSLLKIIATFLSEESRWEALAVGLYVATEILRTDPLDGPALRSYLISTELMELCRMLHPICLRHMEHSEPRIRSLIIQAVGVYLRYFPIEDDPAEPCLYAFELQEQLFSCIEQNKEEPMIDPEIASIVPVTPSRGWAALETHWLCLASVIRALSRQYPRFFTSRLLRSAKAAMSIPSPHVRVAALQAVEQWVLSMKAAEEELSFLDPQCSMRATIVAILEAGLADPSSQVRLAASVLCRTWFETLLFWRMNIGAETSEMMSVLLPRLCFNRFDVALGVQSYSQETWKLLFPTRIEEETPSLGLQAVVQNLPAVCLYYVQQCQSDHPSMRTAAGAAMCELIVRVGTRADYRLPLEPHIASFWHALMRNVAEDAPWSVREAAGVALGALCKTFPEAVDWNPLWALWTKQLTDPMGSEAAAVALADLWEAFGLDKEIRALIHERLHGTSVTETPEDSPSFTDHHCSEGCPNCGRKASYGGVYLIREFVIRGTVEGTTAALSDNELVPLLEKLVDACRIPHPEELRTTLWKCLPTIASALGKQRFKTLYLDIFTELLCSSLESRTSLQVSHSAGQCAEELAALVGPTIFRGRLEEYQRECFDRVMKERRRIPQGPVHGYDVFAHLDSPPSQMHGAR